MLKRKILYLFTKTLGFPKNTFVVSCEYLLEAVASHLIEGVRCWRMGPGQLLPRSPYLQRPTFSSVCRLYNVLQKKLAHVLFFGISLISTFVLKRFIRKSFFDVKARARYGITYNFVWCTYFALPVLSETLSFKSLKKIYLKENIIYDKSALTFVTNIFTHCNSHALNLTDIVLKGTKLK